MIGNSYDSDSTQSNKIEATVNASNDLIDVAYVLRQCGFQVFPGLDVDKKEFPKLLKKFINAIKTSAQQDQEAKIITFFYFAGHGYQVDGVNYLVPENVKLGSIYDVQKYCFNLNTFFESLGGFESPESLGSPKGPKNFATIIALDCCRNHPLDNALNTKPGLAVIDDSVFKASHSLLLFGTRSGDTASDGAENGNGVFTQHLLAALKDQNLKVRDFYSVISSAMENDSNNTEKQKPTAVFSGSLDIRLHPPPSS